ncbi:WD repeat-containing protein 43 [Uranotaenia lowii]|uniref:WD repeat-containing protein 43 n=1 Tax=Uranotaenia lowii TaxID=190385 RepID=UPI00247AC393|nr:WD repeat-containing protein 43 [Uranotaenia lowii]
MSAATYPREFSRDGKYFAFINGQGKFVVYDVETSNLNQIYTPNLHLNVPCTCFVWIELGSTGGPGSSTKKKKKRASIVGEPQNYVAFGTSKGGVALYGLASTKIERTFKGAGHSGSITAIYADVAEDLLYTAGVDGKVIEWVLSQGEQKRVHNLGVEKLTCLTAGPASAASHTVLSGFKQLKLWDTAKGTLEKSFIGHTSATTLIRSLVTEDGTNFALSGSQNDRNITLWNLDGQDRNPVGMFTMEDAPEYCSTRLEGTKLQLVAVSRSGVAQYFSKDLNKISINKPVKPSHTFEIALDTPRSGSAGTVDRLPIFTASVEYGSGPSLTQDQLLLAYGSTELGLKFESIPIDRDVKHNVIIRAALQRKTAEGDRDLKMKTPTVEKSSAEFLNPVSAGKRTLKTVEIPMEARLENLALTGKDGSDTSGRTISGQKNMTHLLIQGLHSKDAAILRDVFSKTEPEVVNRTVERIPAQYVSVLLNELSALMQKKTVHVVTAVCWIKALIHNHASQLMALGSENLLANFGTCLGIIEYRVQHANALSKLSGRLQLLVGQIDRTERLVKNPDDMANAHVLVHQEEDDSDVDSVIGKERGDLSGSSSNMEEEDDEENEIEAGDDLEGDNDSDEDDALAGSFVRLKNGNFNPSENDTDDDGEDDDDGEEDSDDDEMDVSD